MHTFKILKSVNTGVARSSNCPDSLFHLTGTNALKDIKSVLGDICRCRLDSTCFSPNNKYIFIVVEVGFESKAMFNKLKIQNDKRANYLKTLHEVYNQTLEAGLLESGIEVADKGEFT